MIITVNEIHSIKINPDDKNKINIDINVNDINDIIKYMDFEEVINCIGIEEIIDNCNIATIVNRIDAKYLLNEMDPIVIAKYLADKTQKSLKNIVIKLLQDDGIKFFEYWNKKPSE